MGMVRFLGRRIVAGLIVLWVVASLTFFLFFVAVPKEVVARNLAGRAATPTVIAEVERNLGLNRPLPVQYWHYLVHLLHGNLGYSYYTQQPVSLILKQALPITISVVVGGGALWLIVRSGTRILTATRARQLFEPLS